MGNELKPSKLSKQLIGGGLGIIVCGVICVVLPEWRPSLFKSQLAQNVVGITFVVAFIGSLVGLVTIFTVLAPFIKIPKIKRLEVKGVKIEFDEKGDADVTAE